MDNFIAKLITFISVTILLSVNSGICDVLTPYARAFTPTKKINCSQCTTEDVKITGNSIQMQMEKRLCDEKPELYFKPCEGEYRGCGKIVMTTNEIVSGGNSRAVRIVSRFCAKAGYEPEENTCKYRDVLGGYSYVCICNTDNCNFGSRTTIFGKTTLAMTGLVLLVTYMLSGNQ